MKVLLLEDVRGTGKAGETKDVADGYARNYLLPRGLASVATRGALEQVERQRASREHREQKELDDARALAERLTRMPVSIALRTGKGGKLFGSITNADVAAAVKEQHGVVLDRRKIELPVPVRSLGPAQAQVRLHREVLARLSLSVTAG